MAAPVFFVDPGTEPDQHRVIVVSGDEARHAAQVVRLRPGERIDAVDGHGRRFSGTVRMAARDRVEIDVTDDVREPEPDPRIIVIQALAKGDRAEQAVAAMTEVGVDVIVPWAAEHCVTRWSGDRADRGVDKWRATARASAKQARRARVPDVAALHSTHDLEPLLSDAALAVCLDESADVPLASLPVPASGDLVVVVGPEGGISGAERERLSALGAQPARLGPTVLRTSTAGTVGASVVLSRTSRWGGTP
jgi:16S rRNA (uracil1498-N3)-methyltransferase